MWTLIGLPVQVLSPDEDGGDNEDGDKAGGDDLDSPQRGPSSQL